MAIQSMHHPPVTLSAVEVKRESVTPRGANATVNLISGVITAATKNVQRAHPGKSLDISAAHPQMRVMGVVRVTTQLASANAVGITTMGKLVSFPTVVVAVLIRTNALARDHVSQNPGFVFAAKAQLVGTAPSAVIADTKLARQNVGTLGIVTV